jgi:hypothetical protein
MQAPDLRLIKKIADRNLNEKFNLTDDAGSVNTLFNLTAIKF